MNHTPITATLKLDLVNDDVTSAPNTATIEFTPELIALMARSLVSIDAIDGGPCTEVRFIIGDLPMFSDGQPWAPAEDDSGAFSTGCTWLAVENDLQMVSIQIQDESGDAELHANELYANVPGLAEALEAAKEDAKAALRARLA